MKNENEKMKRGTFHETLKEKESQNGEIGPIAGIIIVLVLLIAGALYFFTQEIESTQNNNLSSEAQDILKEKDEITEIFKKQSNSDTIESIEKDLNKTPIENLENGINTIKKELEIL